MLNVWKDLFLGKVFGKTCLSSKSTSGNVETRSDNLPDNFPLKVVSSFQNSKKTQPNSEENYQTEFFYRQISWRKLSGQIKWQFCQFVFKIQKTSAESLEKVLMNSFKQKKTVYVDKTFRICAIQFSQSCWNFSKKVHNFAPKIYENR